MSEQPIDTFIERSYRFQAPGGEALTMSSRTGLDYLRAQITGAVARAPIFETMGMRLIEADQGRVVVEANPELFLYNTLGTIHGGFAATLLDTAMGCAVHTTVPMACAYTTVDLNVNFIRAMNGATGTVIATGEVVHPGRKIATATGRIETKQTGKLIAHGSTTCLLFDQIPTGPTG